ncbi:MAG: hypothetical protein JNK82_27885 [Myxococcaceae bacterium]|nr:hypothetical protein [Myxococcaceae bacterium]
MTRLLLTAFAVSAVAACNCTGGGPPVGVCNGTWAGRTLSDAGLDPSSRVVIEKSKVCGMTDLKRYELSWQSRAVTLDFSFRNGGPSSLSPVDIALPPSTFETYSLAPDAGAHSGTLRLTIVGLQGRRGTSLDVTAGSETLSCTFDVPYVTEGQSACPAGGGGDNDFD